VYSRLLFPDGVEVRGGAQHHQKNSVSSFYDELVEETTSLLNSNETITLFEAAIRSGPYFIRADILHKTTDSTNNQKELQLMEVKAKSWDSRKGGVDEQMRTKKGGIKADYRPYLQDVAFQKMVVQQAFPDYHVSASLVLPDKAKVNTQIPNLNSLFQVIHNYQNSRTEIRLDETSRQRILDADEMLVTAVDVDALVNQVLDGALQFPGGEGAFRDVVATWANTVQEADNHNNNNNNNSLESFPVTPPPIGNQCLNCEFQPSGLEQCWEEATGLGAEQQSDLVTEIFHGGRTTEKLIAAGKFRMSDVEPEDLGLSSDGEDQTKKGPGLSRKEKQWYQVSNTKAVVLDSDYLHSEMSTWDYPYHFIDFETIMPALPYTTGKAPFTTLAFQFSHHIMDRDGSLEHVSEFLMARPGECPNRSFLEALSESLGDNCEGTVFRWGAHENTILNALLRSEEQGAEYPVVESLLTGGERAMVDLMQVLAKGYYAPGSGASSSIKKLLLPTMQASGKLREIYSQPTYSGKNFTNMQWWVESAAAGESSAAANTGVPCDPYALLATFESEGSGGVAQGGDAIAAYEALQREDLATNVRSAMEASLRRYCELDTLAMAMIMQGIQDMLEHQSTGEKT